MAGNSNLHDSARKKQDEFYTQLSLIESELKHYKEHFKGKTVLCNCDDPYESNFFKYFAMNFNSLGLKKLIATCYATSPFVYTQFTLSGDEEFFAQENGFRTAKPYKVEITEVRDETGDGRTGLADVEYLMRNRKNVLTLLGGGDGDFRSPECVELLKEADIVVTNPPFSLFREYMAQLMEYEKSFLIIGNMNAITYKEILPLIMNNMVWLGYNSGHFWFRVPDNYEEKKTDFKIDKTGQKWRRMGNICWFTNLDIQKRHENMTLFRNYTPEAYPKYDNYDAIDVNRTADIPCDYYGIMGVPITFMAQFNPDQFEILGDSRFHDGQDFSNDINIIDGKTKFRRLLIRRKRRDN
ncbi:MAG: adenine-specific methyltransferase EcoRI family protein [Clostridiales bacterium]|nr:adenine-specific methyltransferase EcoRI family protein [Clostridiales bacterium]